MKVDNKILYVTTALGLLLILVGIYLILTFNPEAKTSITLFGQVLKSNNIGLVMCFIGIAFTGMIFKDILKTSNKNISPHNAIRVTEKKLSKNLKDTLALAEFLSNRDGKNVTSTRYFFNAIEIIKPHELTGMIDVLIEKEALPNLSTDEKLLKQQSYSLDTHRRVSNCITDSLKGLKDNTDEKNLIDNSDLFIDVAKYGKGSSVAKMREQGVSPEVIDELVSSFKINVNKRK